MSDKRLIDANERVHMQIYDDGTEDLLYVDMTIAEILDTYTTEGCPPTIEPKWIPCEERLPEEDGTYLVAYTWKGDYSGTIYNEVLLMDFEHGKWESREKILAWQPLPLPYKRGEDNEHRK